MRRFFTGLMGSMIFVIALSSSLWAGPRIAVMDFDNKSQWGGYQLGQGAADILTTELVKTGKFDIYEREQLKSLMQEQDLGASGRVDASTAAKIGKIIGVNFIITGAVTEYGKSNSGISGGGYFNVGKTGYHTAVDIRIVDAVTSKIVYAETATHSKTSRNVKVMGFGGGESFNEKLATETMREAIKEVSAKIAAFDLKVTAAPKGPGKAQIADVDGKIITLSKGSSAGLKSGETLTVKRKGKVIKDPSTGKVIRIKYKTIGKIKMTTVESGYSEAKIVSGNGFKVGDIVE